MTELDEHWRNRLTGRAQGAPDSRVGAPLFPTLRPQAPAAPVGGRAAPWTETVQALRGAYADRTIREYIKSFGGFERWCAARGLDALPASPESVAAYVFEVFQGRSPRTVEARLVAIRCVHRLSGHPDPTATLEVLLAFRRGQRLHGRPPRQAKGLTADLRDRLLAACGDDLIGLRDRVLVGLGYDTLCRRAELAALRVEDLEVLADGSARILVRRSKTDPFGRGALAFMSAATAVVVERWRATAGLEEGPILRPVFKTKAGGGPLHPRTINRRLEALARQAGVEPEIIQGLTSHSMRVGAAQDLAADGRTLIEIMRAGRWRNLEAVMRYAREAPINVWSERPAAARAGRRLGESAATASPTSAPTPEEAKRHV